MKVLTNNRGNYITELKELQPYKILTFTYPTKLVELFGNHTLKLIINTKNAEGKTFPKCWEIKTNNNLHAKIAIGIKGVFLGSWNFSNFDLHECCYIINVEKYKKKYEEFFDRLWDK